MGIQEHKIQILEVVKNTLPTKLYWVLFPIEDLRQAVEMAKRIITKEKIDRQLAGQLSSTPFMSIKDNYNDKRITFDMQDGLEEKIDRLTAVMSKLTANDGRTDKQFNPRYFTAKEEDRQEIFMTNIITIREIIKEFHLVVESSMDKITEVNQHMNKAIGMTLEEETLEAMWEHIKIRILEIE